MSNGCQDCERGDDQGVPLLIVAADLGEGAFLAILCDVCWHRRQYRAELKSRLARGTASKLTLDRTRVRRNAP